MGAERGMRGSVCGPAAVVVLRGFQVQGVVHAAEPPPSILGQVAAVTGEGGDLGRAHHRVVHAAVERDEPRSLAVPGVAARCEHFRDERPCPLLQPQA